MLWALPWLVDARVCEYRVTAGGLFHPFHQPAVLFHPASAYIPFDTPSIALFVLAGSSKVLAALEF